MPLTKQPKIKKKWARMIAPVSIIVTNQNKIMGSSLRLQDISGIIAEQDIFLTSIARFAIKNATKRPIVITTPVSSAPGPGSARPFRPINDKV